MAEETGGRYFEAPTEADLEAVYQEIGSQASYEDEERELTAAFAAVGAALLLLGGSLSALWFGCCAETGWSGSDTAGQSRPAPAAKRERDPAFDANTVLVRFRGDSQRRIAPRSLRRTVGGSARRSHAPSSRAEHSWAISTGDTTPPTVSVDTPLPEAVVRGLVTLTATADDDVALVRVDFLVDGVVAATDTAAPYGAVWDSNGHADGEATVAARAIDSSANSRTEAVRVYVDNTPPATRIDSGPPASSSSAEAAFEFSSDEPGASFECALDVASFAACTSPITYAALAPGDHVFRARATDAAGNVDVTPEEWRWTVAFASPPPPPPPPPGPPPPPLPPPPPPPAARLSRAIVGTAGNDVIVGTPRADVIYGRGGNDRILGGGGNDRLYGGSGNDVLLGGPGADVLEGGPGRDTLYARDRRRDRLLGGQGRDRARIDRAFDLMRAIERLF